MAGTFELDKDTFWEVAAQFHDFDYQYVTASGEHRHRKYRDATPGYPDQILADGDALGDAVCLNSKVFSSLRSDTISAKPEQGGRRFINCCMFVEAAVLGTAYRMKLPGFTWPMKLHKYAMFDDKLTGRPNHPPPMAYAEAYLAKPIDHKALEALEPETIYVCQSSGHTFFIIDYDEATDRVLTLEATHTREFALSAEWWGGVGYRGVGRVKSRPPAAKDWSASRDAPTWRPPGGSQRGGKRADIICMATLNVRESAYAPSTHLPFDAHKEPSPPARYYSLAETEVDGGYFPVGIQRNLHGGVHLPLAATRPAEEGAAPPPAAPAGPAGQAVHALGPGEIVAARLCPPGDDATSSNARSLDLTGNYNGFVLVRHRIVIDEKQTLPVYVLYMHLMPPKTAEDLYAQVPWFARLKQQELGAIIEVDPTATSFRRRHWPAARAKAGPLEGPGAVPLVGGASLELKGPAGRVAAVRRDPEGDVAEAIKALTKDEQVATFVGPFLPVEKGELLGYIAAVPADKRPHAPHEPGFLHWEVLSPVVNGESDLQRLLALAEARLDLGAGFFREVAEQSTNNMLDGGEVDALRSALPPATPPAEAPKDTWPDELTELMKTPPVTALPFSLPMDGEPQSTALDYAVKLELQVYEHDGVATLADGPLSIDVHPDGGAKQTVSLTVTGGKAEGVVHLPAGTRTVSVSAGPGISLDPGRRGAMPREALHELEAAYFKRLTSTRWRNVRLRHLNEWSLGGLKKTLEARGVEDLESLSKAIAWWGHAENPIVGAEGAEKKLFGGELPAAAEQLDCVHPVTFAWLLDLLVGRKAASFGASGAAGHEARVLYAGWLPAEERTLRVGDPVWAIAIASGDVSSDAGVAFFGRNGERRVPLGRAAWSEGSAALAVAAPLWGDWTLEVEPAATPAPAAIGSTTLTAKRPTLAATIDAPVARGKTGQYSWTIDFAADRPARLNGWVRIETLTSTDPAPPADGTWTLEKQGIPLHLLPPAAAATGGLVEEKGFYISGPGNIAVSTNFTYGEYCKAAGKAACKLSLRLVEAVQAIRTGAGRTGLTVSALQEDGLAVTVSGPPLATLEGIVTAVTSKLPPGTTTADAAGKLRVTVGAETIEGGAGGPLAGEFSPAETLRAVMAAQTLSPGQRLHVRFRCQFLNGAEPDDEVVPDMATLEAGASADDRLEASAEAHSCTLSQAGMGEVKFAIEASGKLALSADLIGGDALFWRAAQPRFKLGQETFGSVDRAAKTLTHSLLIATGAHANKTIAVHTTCLGATAPDGNPVAVADGAVMQIDTTPAILTPSLVEEPAGTLLLKATLQAWAPDKDVEVRLLDADKKLVPLPAGSIHYDLKTAAGFGRCDEAGAFSATVQVATIGAALPDGDSASFFLELGRPARFASGVLGTGTPRPTEAVPYTLTATPAERAP